MLASGAFHLAYQPVVDLKRNALHHFEALARFDLEASPADTIRLAEELDLILDFDLAVARTVARLLAKSPSEVKIAANVSGQSLMQPRFVEALTEATAFQPGLRSRLLLEVTETQAITDLPQANRILAELRRLGHVVCLDDFGAGAASLDYLLHLEVDIVKVDGRFIQSLDGSPRAVLLLKHVAALCRELKVLTIAEMIETPEVARLTCELGIDFGQGWHFSKPLPEPKWRPESPPPPPPLAARRRGAVEQWG
jgi:EAL domain-containing protein (putative c-di-GMP-specific phosphodiesterase class I)